MICETCKAEGQTSTIAVKSGGTTCVYYEPFYDEAGVYHHHDGNVTSVGYYCSRGHVWHGRTPQPKCPGCAWPNTEKTEASVARAVQEKLK